MKRIVLALKILGILVLVGIISLSVLHHYLLDGLDGWFFSAVLDFEEDEDTVYAPGYTDKGFRRIKRGMTEQEVLNILGVPLGEVWIMI
jgi:outer membrane protein assembly factor BamE (lipoprotein component of BamABCDE complex)